MTLIRIIETRELYVELPADEADDLLAERDLTHLAEEYARLRRVAHGRLSPHSEGDLVVEAGTRSLWVSPLDGTKSPSYLWTARNAVADARYELGVGRYREGNCSELDEVNRELGVLEERLRVMALAAEGRGPDFRPLEVEAT